MAQSSPEQSSAVQCSVEDCGRRIDGSCRLLLRICGKIKGKSTAKVSLGVRESFRLTITCIYCINKVTFRVSQFNYVIHTAHYNGIYNA